MPEQPEALFKKRAKLFLERRGCFVICPSDSFYRGISDLLVCYNGRYVALELKKGPKRATTELQKLFLGHTKRAGGVAGSLREMVTNGLYIWRAANKDATLGDSQEYPTLELWAGEVLGIA